MNVEKKVILQEFINKKPIEILEIKEIEITCEEMNREM
jgi:hypothetical protein